MNDQPSLSRFHDLWWAIHDLGAIEVEADQVSNPSVDAFDQAALSIASHSGCALCETEQAQEQCWQKNLTRDGGEMPTCPELLAVFAIRWANIIAHEYSARNAPVPTLFRDQRDLLVHAFSPIFDHSDISTGRVSPVVSHKWITLPASVLAMAASVLLFISFGPGSSTQISGTPDQDELSSGASALDEHPDKKPLPHLGDGLQIQFDGGYEDLHQVGVRLHIPSPSGGQNPHFLVESLEPYYIDVSGVQVAPPSVGKHMWRLMRSDNKCVLELTSAGGRAIRRKWSFTCVDDIKIITILVGTPSGDRVESDE